MTDTVYLIGSRDKQGNGSYHYLMWFFPTEEQAAQWIKDNSDGTVPWEVLTFYLRDYKGKQT